MQTVPETVNQPGFICGPRLLTLIGKKEQAHLKFTQAGEPGHLAFHVSTERMTEMGRWREWGVHWAPEKLMNQQVKGALEPGKWIFSSWAVRGMC